VSREQNMLKWRPVGWGPFRAEMYVSLREDTFPNSDFNNGCIYVLGHLRIIKK
jgi:hypothetical protein